MVKTKKIAKNNLLLILVVSVVVCAVLVLAWMLAKEVYLDDSKVAKENSENIVINNIKAPTGLVAVLLAADSNCQGSKNVDYIDRVTDGFALVRYGCSLDALSVYKEQNGIWTALTTTNQFMNGRATCAFLKLNAIPKSIAADCYEGNLGTGITPPIVANPNP